MSTEERIQALFGAAPPGGTPGQLTQEQVEIVHSKLERGQSLTVEAGAGTGKTTCMVEFSKAKPKSKILYICFNNKGAAEARDKYRKAGVFNTTACTIHALASTTKKLYEKTGKFQTRITVKDIQKHHPCASTKAWEILETIRKFCESDRATPEIEDVPKLREEAPETRNETLKEAREVWGKMIDPTHPAPLSYDHYLKVFVLTDPKLDYDYILLDEAQDSNALTLGLLKKQRQSTRLLLIGDTNQNIYSWRGAHNALESWETDRTLPLSESFRFGKQVAAAANALLRGFYKQGKSLKGHKPQDSVGPIPPNMRHTLIARTNATLFEEAINQIDRGRKYHFVGTKPEENWDPSVPYRFNDALDVYRLYIGDRSGVKNPHILAFDSYAELKTAATGGVDSNQPGDKDLESLCRVVEKHSHRLPGIIARIVANCASPAEADILLTTGHRAKGLEWPRVRMADDFAKLVIRKPEEGNIPRLATLLSKGADGETQGEIHPEEINLIYVALTRATERVEPNAKTLEFLKARHLLPPGTIVPEIQPSDQYKPIAPEPIAPEQAPTPERPGRKPRPETRLKIAYGRRDEAKKMAAAAGGRLRWSPSEKSWFWSHPSGNPPPKTLTEFPPTLG